MFFVYYSGSTVNVHVQLEREDEVAGPVIAPLFPQVTHKHLHYVILPPGNTQTPALCHTAPR